MIMSVHPPTVVCQTLQLLFGIRGGSLLPFAMARPRPCHSGLAGLLLWLWVSTHLLCLASASRCTMETFGSGDSEPGVVWVSAQAAVCPYRAPLQAVTSGTLSALSTTGSYLRSDLTKASGRDPGATA
eukprot:RCo053189